MTLSVYISLLMKTTLRSIVSLIICGYSISLLGCCLKATLKRLSELLKSLTEHEENSELIGQLK